MKAGPDGESIGDCPFAHFVRAVIHAKGLECKVNFMFFSFNFILHVDNILA